MERMSGGAVVYKDEVAAAAASGFSDFGRSEGETGVFRANYRDSASESSSIGLVEDSPGESEGDDEAQSEFMGGLGSMGSLEGSLPVKRGLSNFYTGKSRSFATLSDALSVKDLAKPENAFNKRRRILMAYKAKSHERSFFGHLNTSMPNIILEEESEDEKDDKGEDGGGEKREFPFPPLPVPRGEFNSFKHPRSFSLADLADASLSQQ